MPTVKDFRPRGMNLRSSDTRRPSEYASDIVNMEPDSAGDWIKRRGFEDLVAGSAAIDCKEYKRTGDLLLLSPSQLKRMTSAGVISDVNFGGDAPANSWAELASWAEYNDCSYWTDPVGNNELYKFDGYMAYRAGVNKAVFAGNGIPGTARYYRVAYYFIDMQGQIHWGDYTQLDNITDTSFLLTTLNGTEFYNKYGAAAGGGPHVINSGNRTISTIGNHNYVAGDFLRVEVDSGKFKAWEVESVVPNTSITFTAASIGTDVKTYASAEVLERRWWGVLFESNAADYGYVLNNYIPFTNDTATFAFVRSASPDGTPMEDIYDTTRLKGLPPKCSYISIYNNVMVMGKRAILNNDLNDTQDTTVRDRSTIFWSDVGVGSTVETFSPSDTQVVGDSSEGDITGLFSASDSMVLFKETEVYFLNGILTGRLFRIRGARTNKIGCVAHRSVIRYGGGCIFLSSRGIYFTMNGQNPVELSDIVEPYFTADTTGLDFTKSIAILSAKDEKFYLYTQSSTSEANDSVLCFDYKYKDWFKYSAVPARGGFELVGEDLFFIKSTGNVFKRQDTRLDDASAINASYKSGWWDLDNPSLKKKFVNFVLLSTSGIVWEATVKTQCNWNESEDRTDNTLDMEDKIRNLKLGMDKAYAMRFLIENNEKSVQTKISGYEFEWEPAQTVTKGAS